MGNPGEEESGGGALLGYGAFAQNHDTPRFHPEKFTAFLSLSFSLACLDLSIPHWSIQQLSDEERERGGWLTHGRILRCGIEFD